MTQYEYIEHRINNTIYESGYFIRLTKVTFDVLLYYFKRHNIYFKFINNSKNKVNIIDNIWIGIKENNILIHINNNDLRNFLYENMKKQSIIPNYEYLVVDLTESKFRIKILALLIKDILNKIKTS